jgi:DNA polymerase I
MKSLLWLLDIDHETVDGLPEIRLWGVNDHDQRLMLIDHTFRPYFYLIPTHEKNVDELVADIKGKDARYPAVVNATVEQACFFGKSVRVVKIVCTDAAKVSEYSNSMAKSNAVKDHLEDDLRPSYLYLLDNGLEPCGWHQVELDKEVSRPDVRVDGIYELKTAPIRIEKHVTPSVRILAFTTIRFSKKGTPKGKTDPVVVISTATNGGETKQFVIGDSKDGQIIEEFVSYIQSYDPDLIVGYGSNTVEWPYLIQRAKINKLELSVGRTGAEPHRSMYGHMSIAGRANIDLSDLAEGMQEIKIKTLWNFLDFLGVSPKESVKHIEDFEIPKYWGSPDKRRELLTFSRECASGILEAAKATIDFVTQLSTLTGMPLDYVTSAAVGFRVDSYLMKQAKRLGELIPRRLEQPYIPYRGAIVLEPKPGIHGKIAVLDFTAMYPNLMILHNISPDTLLEPGSSNVSYTKTPEVGYRFRKEPPGFYKAVLSNLLSAREDVKKALAKLDPNSSQYEILKERENAIKVITNATYGYAGWIGARWYVKEVAESAAAFGRDTLLKVIEMARSMRLDIMYGDTDSIFVTYEPEKVEKLLSKIKQDLGMDVKVDKIYERVIFTEAKKRYAGLLPNGKLDVVGMEAVRGDWANIAKTVQEDVLELVLRDNNERRALDSLRNTITRVRAKNLPLQEFIIWKTLTKPVKEYEARSAHVEVAKKLMHEGWDLAVGDKVGFIITNKPGKLYEKAQPYSLSTLDDVDVEYYVNSQIIPAAMRVLSVLGVTETQLNLGKRAPSLADFS